MIHPAEEATNYHQTFTGLLEEEAAGECFDPDLSKAEFFGQNGQEVHFFREKVAPHMDWIKMLSSFSSADVSNYQGSLSEKGTFFQFSSVHLCFFFLQSFIESSPQCAHRCLRPPLCKRWVAS